MAGLEVKESNHIVQIRHRKQAYSGNQTRLNSFNPFNTDRNKMSVINWVNVKNMEVVTLAHYFLSLWMKSESKCKQWIENQLSRWLTYPVY